MEDIGELYRRKFTRKLEQYNKPMSLPSYFEAMIGDKKEVVVAEVGAGPVNTIGNMWKDIKVTVVASDVLQPAYEEELWKPNKAELLVPIEYQDFEKLTYPDEMFDIVHCVNALDHTENPRAAIEELKRVCKKGGWIYLRHSPYQMKRFKGHHQWNIYIEGDRCVFQGKHETFFLDEFFTTPNEENLIISTLCKT